MNRRVVITGTGVISSIGLNTGDFWKNSLKGITNVARIPRHWYNYADYNSDLWSPLNLPVFEDHNINRIEQKKLDKTSMLAMAACLESFKNAGLETVQANEKNNTYNIKNIDSRRAGIYMGTGIGGVSTLGECFANQIQSRQYEEIEKLLTELKKRDDADEQVIKNLTSVKDKMVFQRRFNPFAVSVIMANSPAANIAIKYNINGVNNTFSAACASGTVAAGNAYRSIKYNTNDIAVTGGVEYFYDDYGALFYSFDVLKTLVQNCSDPDTANRPFDRDRSGFLYSGGGCAVLIMEELEHAKKRGADIIAEVTGFSETCDGYSIMVIDDKCDSIVTMIRSALDEAGITDDLIDYINTHGTGTQVNDEIESKIINDLFKKKPYINSTKSILGHTLGASGAIETVVTALSIKNKTSHICKNLVNPVRDLNFITKTGELDIKYAMTQSFGFGGHNACLILKEYV